MGSMPSPSLPKPPARQRFRRQLLAWYRAHGRDLPWRRTSDPYHILVSEVMLQQTQVDRVLPKYHEWLDRYPSLAALATADEGDVTQTWRPLGYNIRPRRLQSIARVSGALRRRASFRRSDATLLQGHRRLHRGRNQKLCVRATRRDPRHECRAGALPHLHRTRRPQDARDAQAALGGIRSTRASQARLRLQPGVDGLRRNRLRGAQAKVRRVPDDADVPFVSQVASRIMIVVVAAVIEQDGLFLVTRRLEGTHLAGLWEFPGGKIAGGESHEEGLTREIREELDTDIDIGELVFETQHAYADRSISLHFYRCSLRG